MKRSLPVGDATVLVPPYRVVPVEIGLCLLPNDI